jgi:nitrite reductase/ring-hydroxylating ferredoxin subunit
MPEFTRVAAVSNIPPGTGKAFRVNGIDVAVFNVGGKFHAISNTCGHRGGPLAEGALSGCKVACPWHGWEYDVTSGQSDLDENACLPSFEVSVQGSDVLVAAG